MPVFNIYAVPIMDGALGNERLTDIFAAACHAPDGFTGAQPRHENACLR